MRYNFDNLTLGQFKKIIELSYNSDKLDRSDSDDLLLIMLSVATNPFTEILLDLTNSDIDYWTQAVTTFFEEFLQYSKDLDLFVMLQDVDLGD